MLIEFFTIAYIIAIVKKWPKEKPIIIKSLFLVIIPIRLNIKEKNIPGKYDLSTNFLPWKPIITFSRASPNFANER